MMRNAAHRVRKSIKALVAIAKTLLEGG